jgi:hypothetical protein
MKRRSTLYSGLLALAVYLTAWCVCPIQLYGQGYLTPTDVVMPPEKASQESVDQSAAKASLRFLGLDVFPHATVTAMYDDNLFISHTRPVSDLEWMLAPGLTLIKGDVSTYLPGSVTLVQLRDLLDYSLVDDSARPQRFIGIDYTPSVNVFTEHGENNNVDQFAGLSAGYAFSRLAVGLDQDYSHVDEKNNEAGTRLTRDLYETRLRNRYELTDRTSLEVNGKYSLLDYPDPRYQGFQEVRNENWFNRQVGAKVNAGFGLAFGFVFPQVQSDQTYEQAAVRGVYRLSGKMDLRLTAGAEYRQYGSERSDTVSPVFSLAAIYQLSEKTIFTLDGHRMDYPSPFGDYNYQTLGVYGGVRQELVGGWSVSLSGGYDSIEYVYLLSGPNIGRSDGYFSLRASVDYEMHRRMKASIFYIRRQDDSTMHQYSYVDNMTGIQIGWRY